MPNRFEIGVSRPRRVSPGHVAMTGFTLIELVAVIVILGTLAVVALPRFVDLSEQAHRATVKATAGQISTGVALVRSEAATSDLEDGCRSGDASLEGFSYGGNSPGKVCLNGNVPIGTTGFVSNNRSEQLWDLFVATPAIQDPDENPSGGWVQTSASDCSSDSFVYCWRYKVDGERIADLRYNNDGNGSVEILWDD